MQIVDAHAHIMDRAWIPDPVLRAWARQAVGRRPDPRPYDEILSRVMVGQSDPDGAFTLAAFERAGVAAGVFPFVDWSVIGGGDPESPGMAEILGHVETVAARHPGIFWYLAGIDPRRPGAKDTLGVLDEPHCVGLKLYPAAGWDITDEEHQWLIEAAVVRDVPIMVHTSPLGGDPLVTPLSRPAALVSSVARYPSATWVFAHAGFEAWWLEAVDLAQGWQSTVLDISMWQRVAFRDYGEFRRRMTVVIERLGAHRVLFGSDILRGERTDPDGTELARWVDCMVALGEPFQGADPVCSAEQLALIMGENARRVYRLQGVGGTSG